MRQFNYTIAGLMASVLLVAVGFAALKSTWVELKTAVQVSYSPWLLEQVQTDNIESVTFRGLQIHGLLREPAVFKASNEAEAQRLTRFATSIPTTQDLNDLIRTLGSPLAPGTDGPRRGTQPRVMVESS
jgi:hypothetical protein